MKKAVFFTLGLTMFAFIILSLSYLFSDNAARYDERFAELASVSRVYDLSYSLQNSIAEMFQMESGITYTASSTEAIFQLNHPINFTKINNSFNAINDFVKEHDNQSIILGPMPKNLSMTIVPHDIVFWQNTSENTTYYTVRDDDNPPASYSFLVDLFEVNITSCNSSSSSGTFRFYVSAVGGNGSSCNTTLSIDPEAASYIGITAGTNAVIARVSDYAASLSAGKTNIALTTRVGYNATEEEDGQREIIVLNQDINVSIKGLIIKSFSNVRLTQ